MAVPVTKSNSPLRQFPSHRLSFIQHFQVSTEVGWEIPQTATRWSIHRAVTKHAACRQRTVVSSICTKRPNWSYTIMPSFAIWECSQGVGLVCSHKDRARGEWGWKRIPGTPSRAGGWEMSKLKLILKARCSILLKYFWQEYWNLYIEEKRLSCFSRKYL